MWSITFIGQGCGKPKLHAISTPNALAAGAIFRALKQAGWAVRMWSPEKALVH